MANAPRVNLLRLRQRDALRELELLDAGQLWHALSEDDYRGVLFDTLEDVEAELSGEEYRYDDNR